MDTLMAATVLSSLPPIVLYVIFNKSMLNSLTIGGLKE
jgi:ABC-type glycerol-3-phosphate transport system permease component